MKWSSGEILTQVVQRLHWVGTVTELDFYKDVRCEYRLICLFKINVDRLVNSFISITRQAKYSSKLNCCFLRFSILRLIILKALVFVPCESADVDKPSLGSQKELCSIKGFPREKTLRSLFYQLSLASRRWIFITHNCLEFLTSPGYLSELSLSKSSPISKPGGCLTIIKMQVHLVHRSVAKVSETHLVWKCYKTK